jgi:hypothetical protein
LELRALGPGLWLRLRPRLWLRLRLDRRFFGGMTVQLGERGLA